jgi:hypothetical protein
VFFFLAVPTVTIDLSEIMVNISGDETLSCTYTGAVPDVTSVKWYKEVNGVVSEIVTSPLSPSLTLTSVVMADAGNYTCSATNAVGQSNSSTLELKVYHGMLIKFISQISVHVYIAKKTTLAVELLWCSTMLIS